MVEQDIYRGLIFMFSFCVYDFLLGRLPLTDKLSMINSDRRAAESMMNGFIFPHYKNGSVCNSQKTATVLFLKRVV